MAFAFLQNRRVSNSEAVLFGGKGGREPNGTYHAEYIPEGSV